MNNRFVEIISSDGNIIDSKLLDYNLTVNRFFLTLELTIHNGIKREYKIIKDNTYSVDNNTIMLAVKILGELNKFRYGNLQVLEIDETKSQYLTIGNYVFRLA